MDRRKKQSKKVVEKDRNDMEADVYTKLDRDAGKNIIYEMLDTGTSTAMMLREEHLSRT